MAIMFYILWQYVLTNTTWCSRILGHRRTPRSGGATETNRCPKAHSLVVVAVVSTRPTKGQLQGDLLRCPKP